MRRRGPVSLRDRLRYRFDSTLARSTGRMLGWLALSCVGLVVPVSAVLVWTDPGSPASLSDRLIAVGRVSAETLRLGAVTGAPLRMLLSVLLGLVALLYVSTLIGLITTGLGDRLVELRRGRSTVVESGHQVVLGWSEQVFTVVGELVAARAHHRGGAVVVLADRDKAEMEEALAAALGPTGPIRLICRSGPTTDPATLRMVSPATAVAVLVLPDGDEGVRPGLRSGVGEFGVVRAGSEPGDTGGPREARASEDVRDTETVRTLLALRAVLGEGAEVGAAGVAESVVVAGTAGTAGAAGTAEASGHGGPWPEHAVGRGSTEGRVPGARRETGTEAEPESEAVEGAGRGPGGEPGAGPGGEPEAAGRAEQPPGEAEPASDAPSGPGSGPDGGAVRRPGPAVVASVCGERYREAARLAAGPRGVVLEADRTTAGLVARSALHPGLFPVLRELLDYAGDEFYVVPVPPEAAGRPFGDLLLDCATAAVAGLLRPDGTPLLNPPPDTVPGPGDRLVVVARDDGPVGWADGPYPVDPAAPELPDTADGEPARLLVLGWNRRAPLVVDQLRPTGPGARIVDVVCDPAEPPPMPEPRREAVADGLTVTFRTADLTRPASLRGLDPLSYDRIVVLGPDARDGAGRPDDRTLVTLLVLRALAAEAGREVPVVAELTDHRSRALAPLGPRSEVVVGGELGGLLMAQVSQDGRLAPVFDELFGVGGGTLRLRPCGHYVRPGRAVSFAAVVAAARARGECAIGYRRPDLPGEPAGGGVRLNPPKDELRLWNPHDAVVVVTTEHRDNTPAAGPAGPAGRERTRP
ncbi:NAD-binding lipoprotein [Streptomyces sp. NPDC091281]|uniref:CASTOR/POLLUX-related putative ion channel n=1 Tax=Streptomyces sp. NPDC091281 TaxID=3365985 RepID=UPI00380C9DBB